MACSNFVAAKSSARWSTSPNRAASPIAFRCACVESELGRNQTDDLIGAASQLPTQRQASDSKLRQRATRCGRLRHTRVLPAGGRFVLETDLTHEILEVWIAVQVVPFRIHLQQIHLVIARLEATLEPSQCLVVLAKRVVNERDTVR
jgi:hypothetical protein